MRGEGASKASDVFAYGVVLWELLTLEFPWSTANPWQIVSTVIGGGRLEIPPRGRLPGADTRTFAGLDAFVRLIRACWAQNHLDRPSFQEIIAQLRWGGGAFEPRNARQQCPIQHLRHHRCRPSLLQVHLRRHGGCPPALASSGSPQCQRAGGVWFWGALLRSGLPMAWCVNTLPPALLSLNEAATALLRFHGCIV